MLKTMLSKTFLRPFSCVGVIYVLSEFAGLEVIVTYAHSFLEDAGVKLDPGVAAVCIASMRFVAPLCGAVAMRYSSKKRLFVACGLLAASGLASVSLQSFHWILPLIGASTACFFQYAGVNPTLSLLQSELYPTEVRSLAVGATYAADYAARAASAKLYPTLREAAGLPALTAGYAAVAVAMTLWGAVTMRSTDGLSLAETEAVYDSSRETTPVFSIKVAPAERKIRTVTV